MRRKFVAAKITVAALTLVVVPALSLAPAQPASAEGADTANRSSARLADLVLQPQFVSGRVVS